MTYDSTNYTGLGAVGAVPHPGRNAIGVPATTGSAVQGADTSRPQTLPEGEMEAYVIGLNRHPAPALGVTNCQDPSNELVTPSADFLAAVNELQNYKLVDLKEPLLVPPV